MSRTSLGRRSCAILSFCLLATPNPAGAQSAEAPADSIDLGEVVVTANRTPQPLQRAGSAITVISGDEIAKTNPASLADVLRYVPGLDVVETGGPGGTSSVKIRGANPSQTLVLLDGVRINDPAQASGEFDFSILMPGAIDRIEVLRGPQSALYGSDAIGGVVNIITKKGKGPASIDLRSEAGRYGTVSTNGTVSGSQGPWSYTFSGGGQRNDGFSRYGYRIGRIESRFPNLENDGLKRFGGYGRVGYDPGNGFRFETGVLSTRSFADYDLGGSGRFPDTPSQSEKRFTQIWGKASLDTFDGILTHNLTIYANRTERFFRDVSYTTNLLPKNTNWSNNEYNGNRYGIEYQGDLKLGRFGLVTFGGRYEQEKAEVYGTDFLPKFTPRTLDFEAEQISRSLFALWQLPIGDRLDLSLGGRSDAISGADRFNTWRATLAYRITETDTKLRASVGTGGKAPTLYQLHAPLYGNPTLEAEKSFGVDAGFDQNLFGGRASLSVTVFRNRLQNMIDFDLATSRYYNISRALTSGVEVGGKAEIWQGYVWLTGAYTYLDAKDQKTGLELARRAPNSGKIGLRITPTPDWSIEPSLYMVSERYSSAGEKGRLAPYARLDLYSDYKLTANVRVFGRIENITNAHYQEVLNYGTTGRAFYAGVNATW